MNTRNVAMWFGLAGVVAGAIGIVAAISGDIRLEVGWSVALAAVAMAVLAVGAFVTPIRTLYGAAIMALGVIAVLVVQWTEVSKYATDLWTTATGTQVTFVDAKGVSHSQDFGGVLFGSVAMLGYAGTLILGTIGAVVAFFAPQEETAREFRPEARPI